MPLSASFVTTLAKSTVLEAARSRLFWLAALVVVGSLGLAQFLAQVAITESREIQASILGALLRLSTVFIQVTFVITSMVREQNDKVTELLLSQPVPRASYLLGKLAGYACVAVLLGLAAALPLLPYASAAGLAAWAFSLICELLILTSLSLLCTVTFNHVLPSFAAVGAFYLLARSMDAVQTIAAASVTGAPTIGERFISGFIDLLAMLLPGLDHMALSSWLVDTAPAPSVLVGVFVQTAIYLTLIASASVFDLYRRNF